MRHDHDLARAAESVTGRVSAPRPEWGRLARAGARYELAIVLCGIGVAIAALGLIGGRALLVAVWP